MTEHHEITELYQAARGGSRRSLGRLLTLVERGGAEAEVISELAHPDSANAHVIGITGAPGAGKSTLTGQLVARLVAQGAQPAILAVDPSSPLTGGAILGDRIRMDDLVAPTSAPPTGPAGPSAGTKSGTGAHPAPPTGPAGTGTAMGTGAAGPSAGAESGTVAGAAAAETVPPFIRSMATRGHSGGLSLAVPLAVRLFDAMGYAPVIIETVGVGQVEVDVVGAADTAIVVVTPGMGDAVQANKAGLLEVADVFVVNKADRPGANDVRRDLDLMLDLSHLTGQEASDGYRPPIIMSSAIDGTGAAEVLGAAHDHLGHLDATGQRSIRRRKRIQTEIQARMEQQLAAMTETVLASEAGMRLLVDAEQGLLPPTKASAALLDQLFRSTRARS